MLYISCFSKHSINASWWYEIFMKEMNSVYIFLFSCSAGCKMKKFFCTEIKTNLFLFTPSNYLNIIVPFPLFVCTIPFSFPLENAMQIIFISITNQRLSHFPYLMEYICIRVSLRLDLSDNNTFLTDVASEK